MFVMQTLPVSCHPGCNTSAGYRAGRLPCHTEKVRFMNKNGTMGARVGEVAGNARTSRAKARIIMVGDIGPEAVGDERRMK